MVSNRIKYENLIIMNDVTSPFVPLPEGEIGKYGISNVPLWRGQGEVLVSVKDDGSGIPEHIREKIFQPFFTTKPTGQGTGLGLSLSYDIIIKGHDGEIKVDSEIGYGTDFIIQLPID